MNLTRERLTGMLPPFGLNIVMGFVFGGFAALLPLVRDEFSLSRTQVGFYTTCVFLASFSFALIGGYLIDRLGAKNGLVLGGVVMGFFTGMYALAGTYTILLAFAFLAGLGQSLITPAGNKAIIYLAGGQTSNTFMGILRSSLGIGSLMGASLLPVLALAFGWRLTVFMGAVVCVLAALSVLLVGKKMDPEHSQPQSDLSFRENVRALLKDPRFRFVLLTGFTFAAVLSALMGYLPLWLNEVGGLSLQMAGLGLGLAQFGGVLGRPFWGYLADHFTSLRQEKIIAIEGAIMVFICLLFALAGNIMPALLLLALSFVLGFAGMGFGGIYFGFMATLVGSARLGVATGVAITFLRLAVVVIPPIFGFIADNTSSYAFSWLMVAIFPLLTVISFWFLQRGEGKEISQAVDVS